MWKTTLMKAILGETPVSNSGSIKLSCFEIALCEQSPWVMVGAWQLSHFCTTHADFAESIDLFKYHLFIFI